MMGNNCSICDEELRQRTTEVAQDSSTSGCIVQLNVTSTPCGHLYHAGCIMEWLANNKSCPECRATITKNDLVLIPPALVKMQAINLEEKNNNLTQLKNQVKSVREPMFNETCKKKIHMTLHINSSGERNNEIFENIQAHCSEFMESLVGKLEKWMEGNGMETECNIEPNTSGRMESCSSGRSNTSATLVRKRIHDVESSSVSKVQKLG